MASLPEQTRIYAIGDIHGRADLLADIMRQIAADRALRQVVSDRLVFLGDYVDRGPDSHGVIEHLLHDLPAAMPVDFLMGNHERMLLDALSSQTSMALWLANGGGATVRSYAQAARERREPAGPWREFGEMLTPCHARFYDALRLSVTCGDYIFVHAGVRPGTDLMAQSAHDLLWIREPFLSYTGPFGKVVVHGHTPQGAPEFHHNRIGIDTGAVFTGRLTALVLEGAQQRVLST